MGVGGTSSLFITKSPFILGPARFHFEKSFFIPNALPIINANASVFSSDKQHATLRLCHSNKKQRHVWDPRRGPAERFTHVLGKEGSQTLRTTLGNVRGGTSSLLAWDSCHSTLHLSEFTGGNWNLLLETRQGGPPACQDLKRSHSHPFPRCVFPSLVPRTDGSTPCPFEGFSGRQLGFFHPGFCIVSTHFSLSIHW